MKIAVEGCCHGELDLIYDSIRQLEERNSYRVDLLLICGDFQAVRNWQDLQCMAVPNKYKALQTFYKYYTGEKVAPILTIVIGGNHEASNYMSELHHGGWLAPNIYFLGVAGCVQVNGLRIAGASGIFKPHDFRAGFYERLPYDQGSMRSIYHIRESTIRKLSLLSSLDIFLSHDWPNTIEQFGDTEGLLRRKKFFREEVNTGTLGSPPLMGLLHTLQPSWWFSAHLHVRFEARVPHGPPLPIQSENPDEIKIDDDFDAEVPHVPSNPEEITLDDEEAEVEAPPPPPPPPHAPRETRFLALDKCIKNRDFLEVIDIQAPQEPSAASSVSFTFDPEWLAITRAFHPWFSTARYQRPFPEEADARALVAENIEWVKTNIALDEQGNIPIANYQSFVQTAPGPGSEGSAKYQQPQWYPNPQTDAFCRLLQIDNKIDPVNRPQRHPTVLAGPQEAS